MPSSDRSEKSGNRPPYPIGATFAKLLDWHLKFGTRPQGGPDRPGARWGNVDFSKAVGAEETGKTVRNWRAGRNRPDGLGSIEVALFGKNQAFNEWRFDLRAAFEGQTAEPGVPLPPGIFLGRDGDLDALRTALLSDAPIRAILVQGPPGIGKTALTKAIAHDPSVVEHFGDRPRWFVRLETATTAALLQDAITRAVGADPQAGFRATLALLQQRPGLLVLDNLETPWEPSIERRATEDALAALARVPGLALLSSFRGREHVAGPAWTLIHTVERLAPPFDAELFHRVAGQPFTGDAHLRRFLAALDGVPLAIELVARRAYGLPSLAPLWAEWEKIGTELASHPDFEPGRDTSLPHSIELSLLSSRMTEAARRLFCLLGQLPAGIAPEDRDHLLRGDSFAAAEVLRRIGLAIMRGERLDLLSPIREHARRCHRPEPLFEAAWLMYYLHLARDLGEQIDTRNGSSVVHRLKAEYQNISASIASALPLYLEEAISALNGFGKLSYMMSTIIPVFNQLVIACRNAGNLIGEADALRIIGNIALVRSDHDGALDAINEALILFRRAGDPIGEAKCITNLGDISFIRSELERAYQAYAEARTIFREQNFVQGEANCAKGFGDIALARYDLNTSRTHYQNASALYRAAGSVLGEANCVVRLGEISFRCADYDDACRAFTDALPFHRQLGDAIGEANCLKSLGDIWLARADYSNARSYFDQALLLYVQFNHLIGKANCIARFGETALICSEIETAERAFQEALPIYRQCEDALGEVNCMKGLGEVALARSDFDSARKFLKTALPSYQEFGNIKGEADCIFYLGRIALLQSDRTEYRRALAQAYGLYQQAGDAGGAAKCAQELGLP